MKLSFHPLVVDHTACPAATTTFLCIPFNRPTNPTGGTSSTYWFWHLSTLDNNCFPPSERDAVLWRISLPLNSCNIYGNRRHRAASNCNFLQNRAAAAAVLSISAQEQQPSHPERSGDGGSTSSTRRKNGKKYTRKAHKIKKKNINSSICENRIVPILCFNSSPDAGAGCSNVVIHWEKFHWLYFQWKLITI